MEKPLTWLNNKPWFAFFTYILIFSRISCNFYDARDVFLGFTMKYGTLHISKVTAINALQYLLYPNIHLTENEKNYIWVPGSLTSHTFQLPQFNYQQLVNMLCEQNMLICGIDRLRKLFLKTLKRSCSVFDRKRAGCFSFC